MNPIKCAKCGMLLKSVDEARKHKCHNLYYGERGIKRHFLKPSQSQHKRLGIDWSWLENKVGVESKKTGVLYSKIGVAIIILAFAIVLIAIGFRFLS